MIKATLFCILIVFLCFLVHRDILSHQFMIDERIYLDPSSSVYTQFPHWQDYFLKPLPGEHHYIPLNYLLNVALFKLYSWPIDFYRVNLLLFCANVLLLFIFVDWLVTNRMIAFLTCMFFCVHPMTGEILEHITFNIILLETLFMQLGLMSLYLYFKHRKGIYLCSSVLAVVLAALSQETAVLFPLYAAALIFYTTEVNVKRGLKLLLPFISLSLGTVLWWLLVVNPQVHLEKIQSLHAVHLWQTSGDVAHALFWYLANLFYPCSIVFMANFKPVTNPCVWNLGLLMLLGGGVYLVFRLKKSLEAFALVFFAIGIIYAAVACLTRPVMGVIFEPYWLYFSSMGFFLWVVLMLWKLRLRIVRGLFVILVLVVLGSYATAATNLEITGRSERSYAEHWLRLFPDNLIALNIVASFYYNHKNVPIPDDLVDDMIHLSAIYVQEGVPQAGSLIQRISSANLTAWQKTELMQEMQWLNHFPAREPAA